MTVRVVVFEDSAKDRERLEEAFQDLPDGAKFLWFSNPSHDWIVDDKRAKEIGEYDPSLIILDLVNDKQEDEHAGKRILRQLKESPHTKDIPVVVWSRLFRQKRSATKTRAEVRAGGAIPLCKEPRKRSLNAAAFLEAAGISIL